jgi:SOS-response transcriptional repressor LexA
VFVTSADGYVPGFEPVRLVEATRPAPFAPGRETAFARVSGDALRALDVHDGDHVVLVRRERAEHGDLAAVLDADGRALLWKVYPEGDRLRLSVGRPGLGRLTGPHPRIHGVVVAVLRHFP